MEIYWQHIFSAYTQLGGIMPYYITYGEFQYHLQDYFKRTGSRMQFPEMTDYLFRKGMMSPTPPPELPTNKMFGDLTDEEFDKAVNSFV